MRAHLRRRIERITDLDLRHTGNGFFHETIEDRFLDESAGRTGADLALVESEEGEAFQRLVQKPVILVHDIGEEDIRRLAAEFHRLRDDRLRGELHDLPAGRRLTREGDLGNARAARERRADFGSVTEDDVEHARRQKIADEVHRERRELIGVSEAGLMTTQLPAASAGAIFQAAISIGKFHGMICPTTPIGSRK